VINQIRRKIGFWIGVCLCLITVLSGCEATSTPSPDIPALNTPQESPNHNEADDNNTSPAESMGRLAYIGGDGNIYVTTADRTSTIAITNDATTYWEGAGLSYQRISWSPDGYLAYASVTRSNDKATSKLYVAEKPDESARMIGQSEEHFVIYIYWSPVPCPKRLTCRQLAYLIEESEDISLRLVQMNIDDIDNRIIGFGWPYYFSWAANGEAILWHTGGSSRENNQATIAHYDLDSDSIRALSHPPAAFQAPAWSPQKNHWLGAVSNDQVDELQLIDTDQSISLATISEGGTAFAWSPEGNQVAFAVRANSSERFYGPIHLYDLETGQSRQITDIGLRILAFFWDPAGQRLGYLTLLSMPDAEWLQWRVYDLVNDVDRGFKTFNPTPHMEFVMSSFNQYAQSHRFWSPDGRYLVYGNRDDQGEERVWLIDTRSDDGSNALLVDEGTMGFWSWN